jgi:ATP adenylyltransferase
LDKQKAKKEALAAQTQTESSPEAKRPRRESDGKQNVKEPFKPPYVEELYVGTLEGIEGEEGMSILVRPPKCIMNFMLMYSLTRYPKLLYEYD